jgi:acetyltransferase-like isoleucine patch superfamily enzyme
MSAPEDTLLSGAPGRRPQPLIAAPGETEARSPLRWLARMVLVLCGLPKTIAFNLRYLPLSQAVRLPILVSHRMSIFNFGGTVKLTCPANPGTVLLGFGANGAFDFRRARSVWQNAGEVVFEGPARLGNGFKLSVAESGTVTFGGEFVLSAESQIVCRDRITFGRGCLISWDVLMLDGDFHPLISEDGTVSETHAPIALGDRVWIGARSSILKGVALGDDTVVAAGSIVTKSQAAGGVLLGGNPARVIRDGVRWRH